MLLIANVYIIEGRTDRAIEEYQRIIDEFPHMREQCASAMIALASISRERGDWNEAKEIYERVISEYFDTQVGFQAPLLIARYYKSRAMNAEAGEAYQKAMQLYKEFIKNNNSVPQSSMALEQLINCYGDQDQWHEAISYLQNDIIKNSDSPLTLQAMLITGTIYEVEFSNRDKAFEIYKEVVEKFPEDPLVEKIKYRLGLYGE
jgi:tetratricopeptide (TPR) repeat protein